MFAETFKPIFYFLCITLPCEHHQAIIYVDSVVGCRMEVGFDLLKKLRGNQVG